MGEAQEQVRMMICSVGGAPEPVLFSLKSAMPEYVIFYCSTGTAGSVHTFIRECPFIQQSTVVETDNWEDIEHNLQLLYKELPPQVKRKNVSWEDVLVDYTGGTKTMGAALVLATIDKGVTYAYVSGETRAGKGVGAVVSGSERVLRKSNPWDTIAYQQRREITAAWKLGSFGEAIRLSKILQENVSSRNPWKMIIQALIPVFEGYQEWERFRHQKALDKMKRARSKLQPYSFVEPSIAQVVEILSSHTGTLEQYLSKEATERDHFLLQDLLANAVRRGDLEERYDDAVARLYRALELNAQRQLRSRYSIDTGSCQPEELPEAVREDFRSRYWNEQSGCLKFGVHAAYLLLYAFGDETGKKYHRQQEAVTNRLALRNQSILAHGDSPVSQKGYLQMLDLVLELAEITREELTVFQAVDLTSDEKTLC